jgi:hypothetical protein
MRLDSTGASRNVQRLARLCPIFTFTLFLGGPMTCHTLVTGIPVYVKQRTRS